MLPVVQLEFIQNIMFKCIYFLYGYISNIETRLLYVFGR